MRRPRRTLAIEGDPELSLFAVVHDERGEERDVANLDGRRALRRREGTARQLQVARARD